VFFRLPRQELHRNRVHGHRRPLLRPRCHRRDRVREKHLRDRLPP
jgi:hypothetical protein